MTFLKSTYQFLFLVIVPFSFGQHANNKLSLELSIPHQRELPRINNCSDYLKGYVIIQNNADTTTYFYEDWNSYGYYNITFEIRYKQTVYPIIRPQKYWYRNYHSFLMLHPGESLVFPYKIIDTACARQLGDNGIFENGWLGFPQIADTVEIRAIYQLCHLEDSIPEDRITLLNYKHEDYIDYLDGDIEAPFIPDPKTKSDTKQKQESPFLPVKEIIFHEPLYSDWQKVILLR